MPKLDVQRKPATSDLYDLQIDHGDAYIGDYEQSIADKPAGENYCDCSGTAPLLPFI